MDLKDQLQDAFPDHEPPKENRDQPHKKRDFWIQEDELLCKYEKRKGKPVVVIDNYNGAESDFKKLTKLLKKKLSTGGSHKNEQIILQGDFRKKVMAILEKQGFAVKRVGG